MSGCFESCRISLHCIAFMDFHPICFWYVVTVTSLWLHIQDVRAAVLLSRCPLQWQHPAIPVEPLKASFLQISPGFKGQICKKVDWFILNPNSSKTDTLPVEIFECWCYLASQPAFQPVLSRTILIKTAKCCLQPGKNFLRALNQFTFWSNEISGRKEEQLAPEQRFWN